MSEKQVHQIFHLLSRCTANTRDNIRTLYLARLGSAIIDYCLHYYRTESKAEVRSDYVRFVIQYSRTEPKAIELAKIALRDKSKKVRKKALAVFAYSIDSTHLTFLKSLENKLNGNEDDLKNAIEAITKKNRNLFYPQYDRWVVSRDNTTGHLDKEQFTKDINFYIETHAKDCVPELKNILGSLYV